MTEGWSKTLSLSFYLHINGYRWLQKYLTLLVFLEVWDSNSAQFPVQEICGEYWQQKLVAKFSIKVFNANFRAIHLKRLMEITKIQPTTSILQRNVFTLTWVFFWLFRQWVNTLKGRWKHICWIRFDIVPVGFVPYQWHKTQSPDLQLGGLAFLRCLVRAM